MTLEEKILKIAEDYIKDTNLKPHMNCVAATMSMKAHLIDNKIPDVSWQSFVVDLTHYNGELSPWMKIHDRVEHHCIKIGRKILDVTASQFNNCNGEKMPKIYFGSRPIFYKEDI